LVVGANESFQSINKITDISIPPQAPEYKIYELTLAEQYINIQ